MKIAIIGAGAAGMMAALAASENPGAQVLLLERQARVGRKLSATGNGRCNLSNLHALEGGYHGADAAFCRPALEGFSPEQTLAYFDRLGLCTVAEPSGRVYPYSDQANSVVDILRFALDRPNLTLETDFEVRRVKRLEGGFSLTGQKGIVECDRLIVACGGLAGTKLGGSMSGYQLLRALGHSCTRLRPALVQLRSDWSGTASLKGVRANCRARLLWDEVLQCESTGEIQFTDYGLSGPVIFEISRDACSRPGLWMCELDFLPQWSQAELLARLQRRRESGLNCEELLTGILHNRLGRILTRAVGLRPAMPVAQLSETELGQVCAAVKGFRVELTEPMGMDCAQVTAGGIVTAEFDPMTLESRLVPGLYACGEVLDVDGDCGGYNLQWAWSSGRLAGLCAGKDEV